MNKRAAQLLELLEDHVTIQWHWEQHLCKAVNNGFGSMAKETTSQHKVTMMRRGLKFDCKAEGFEISQLDDIIPRPFHTNHADRVAILEDLKQYAEKKYE